MPLTAQPEGILTSPSNGKAVTEFSFADLNIYDSDTAAVYRPNAANTAAAHAIYQPEKGAVNPFRLKSISYDIIYKIRPIVKRKYLPARGAVAFVYVIACISHTYSFNPRLFP